MGGLIVSATAMAASPSQPSRTLEKAQQASVSPFWADDIKGDTSIIVFPGGDGEFVPQGGTRADPCTLGENNSYDRPGGNAVGNTAPYATAILGAFNLDRFFMADDFIPSASGNVTSLCWRGIFSDDVCANDANPSPHIWTANFYNVDSLTGLPGTLIASRNTNPGGNMVVAQGQTGLPVGINPNLIEMSMSATISGSAISVAADTCYFVELYFDSTNANCFYTQAFSYELDEGNNSSLRRNDRLFTEYGLIDFINLDMAISVGFNLPGTTLVPSNSDFCGPTFPRFAPGNDNIAGAQIINCNGQVEFDNTYATHVILPSDPISCRKSTVDIVDYTSGDMWFRINPNPNTSMRITLCNSEQLSGLAGGDSLLQVFRLTVIANGANINNLTQVGCSDDACIGGLSQVDAGSLNALPAPAQNQNFYIRVSSFTPVAQGVYTINTVCPIPIPANDFCEGATNLPGNVAGPDWTDPPLGAIYPGVNSPANTFTASVDGGAEGCGGSGSTSPGVWFTLTGRGNRVIATTDEALPGGAQGFDTVIAVYCGDCDETQSGLNCIAANDDASETTFFSEVEWCARDGVQYYVLVKGFGTATGNFLLRVTEAFDETNTPIVCCDPQVCVPNCTFEIPFGARAEGGENTPGAGPDAVVEACISDGTYSNTNQFNDGCSLTPPVGEDRRFDVIQVGETISGNLWASQQQFDRDWILFEGLDGAAGATGVNLRRTVVQYAFGAEGPIRQRQFAWGAIADFSDCTPMAGFLTGDLIGTCSEEFDRIFVFDNSVSPQAPGRGATIGFLASNLAVGAGGFPCGTNTRYWLTLTESIPATNCTPIWTDPLPIGTDDERLVPTVDGSTGDDGFAFGEICVDPPLAGSRRKAGCFAPVITNGEFLLITPGTPMAGICDGTVGAQGGSRDVDFYKFTLTNGRYEVSLSVNSAFVFVAQITNDDCTAGAETYATAATRGTCSSNSATADDLVVLDGDVAGTVYQVAVFATDAFVAIGGTAIFSNYLCNDSISKYLVEVNATLLPDCSETTICATPSEDEPCTLDIDDTFDPCSGNDNDGCSEAKFFAGNISSGNAVCGTLFSAYEPAPFDIFVIDQDYYQFTVTSPSRITYGAAADGPVRVLLANTGAASGISGDADEFGGGNCYGPDALVVVVDAADAEDCTSASTRTAYLAPGTYSFIVTPGSTDVGISFNDYRCPNVLTYSLSMTLEAVGRCCVGTDCITTTAADCSSLSGDFTAAATVGDLCGPTYAAGAFMTPGNFASIIGGPGTVQVVFDDVDDAITNVQLGTAFTLFGRTYSGSQLNVSTNGFVTLGNASDDNTAAALNFPNSATPNAVIAPFLHDWDLTGGGTVHVQVNANATTIQWTNVRRHDNFAQTASFQAILDRTTTPDSIRFVYGTFTGLGGLDVTSGDGDRDAVVGVEDETGLNGLNVGLDAAFLTGNRRVAITFDETPCSPAVPVCCVGNADKIVGPGNDVSFADVTAVLAAPTGFGNPSNPNGTSVGDADCNGVVNFADITAVLTAFNFDCNP